MLGHDSCLVQFIRRVLNCALSALYKLLKHGKRYCTLKAVLKHHKYAIISEKGNRLASTAT